MALPGLGTLINAAAIVAGASLGTVAGGRLPARVRDTVTDALGLVTLVIGGLDLRSLVDPVFSTAVGSGGTLLIVLGALVVGAAVGAAVHIEGGLERVGGWLQQRLTRDSSNDDRANAEDDRASSKRDRAAFTEGFVSTSLVVAVGPLAILGALSDGLGNGIDQLALKSVLDGVVCIAFAASLGWGVAAAALSVIAVEGAFTVLGATLGTFLPAAEIAAITAVGGVLLLGVGLRLLSIKPVPVADMLPALVVAPLLTWAVTALR